MYQISIKSAPGNSSVAVAEIAELDAAISFGFQLHQVSNVRHCITVSEKDETLATYVRKETIIFPNKSSVSPQEGEGKKVFGLRKKS